MLRKRSGSIKKDPKMGQFNLSESESDSYFQSIWTGQSHNASSLLPGLFVGCSPKALSDCDSVSSPTSPLDFRAFSSLGKTSRSPRAPCVGQQKCWDCSKVGLSIVDSLENDPRGSSKVLRSSDSKSILFGPQVRVKNSTVQPSSNSFEAPKSLPKNFANFHRQHTMSPIQKGNSHVIFEIGETPPEPDSCGKILSCSLDSCRPFSRLRLSHLADRNCQGSSNNVSPNSVSTLINSPGQSFRGSTNSNYISSANMISAPESNGSVDGLTGSFSASEIELSEEYTCVILHGPNPKKTHIFGDCIMECQCDDLSNFGKKEEKEIGVSQADTGFMNLTPNGLNHFLSFCYYCNKKLEDGEDIYIYGGEKAFCSLNCRMQEIMVDEELENTNDKASDAYRNLEYGEELSEAGIFDAP
ncbi:hypothetical protein K2173_025847 [Erythroxylum novogranatense]|uniref:FLZ-type domain-containing protein n=1 Tax=Erythroxylum novogranatense TaxID=1862640 RepID=A0AAV8SI59_9ROSI|nr:hypothetical protein K2173_025847 [Erythroxylum novogranatense]